MIFFIKAWFVFIALLVCLSASIYLYLALYVAKHTPADAIAPADVIVVLGAKAYSNGYYNPCLVARVKHAVGLYKANYAPKLLFSGGTDKEDNRNEAETMKQIALSLGVKANAIVCESRSTSTYENLLFTKKILEKNHLHSIILVTEPFHAPRAMLVAKKLGLQAISSPATQSMCWRKNTFFSFYFLKEPLAIAWYKVVGKL